MEVEKEHTQNTVTKTLKSQHLERNGSNTANLGSAFSLFSCEVCSHATNLDLFMFLANS